ncbi:hypothetical protein [Bradyrhizobium sp. LB13.1]
MRRIMTMLVTTMLAASMLAARAEARGGGAHIGGFGGGRVSFGDHVADGSGFRHSATHRFGGIWPGYGGLFDYGLDCYNPHYQYPPYHRPPYCG